MIVLDSNKATAFCYSPFKLDAKFYPLDRYEFLEAIANFSILEMYGC